MNVTDVAATVVVDVVVVVVVVVVLDVVVDDLAVGNFWFFPFSMQSYSHVW